MNLDEAQKKTVAGWIAEGLKLSDIQKRIASELGVNLTYMEVRFLVDDLKLTPKDTEPPKQPELTGAKAPSAAAPAPPTSLAGATPGAATPAQAGAVTVTVDSIARPGAVASGNVTFSDGKTAEWYLDEMGRLGLLPQQQGYRPSAGDVRAFQSELQAQLAKLGF